MGDGVRPELAGWSGRDWGEMCGFLAFRDASGTPLACRPPPAMPPGPGRCQVTQRRALLQCPCGHPPLPPPSTASWVAVHWALHWALREVIGLPDGVPLWAPPPAAASGSAGWPVKDGSCPTMSSSGSSRRFRSESSCWPVCAGEYALDRVPWATTIRASGVCLCSPALRKPLQCELLTVLSPCKPPSC